MVGPKGTALSNRGLVHIGTSGWHYNHWRGSFYPAELDPDQWLRHYSQRFGTVEINNSFYQLPARENLLQWRDAVPPEFIFAVKASRYITHLKKLLDPMEPATKFVDRVSTLGDRLGPILFQLPPNWGRDAKRLSSFLRILPKDYRYAFEFRDPSWFDEEVYQVLQSHGAAFCMYHFADLASPKKVTADWIYVRFHGPDGAYHGSYSTESLSGWAGAFATWSAQGKEIYCYFNNDAEGHAPRDAARLQAMFED
jgi:uncharacterized protein YecE (DUF72 family)